MEQSGSAIAGRTRRRVPEHEKRRHLDAWRGLRVSQAEYCRRNGLSPKTFRKWNRADRVANGGVPRLVPVRAVDTPPAGTDRQALAGPGEPQYEIALANGRVVRVPGCFDGDTLSRLLAVAERPC
jgi:transposase-like protein